VRFNDLLTLAGHAPKDVAIMLHMPSAYDLRRSLLELVDEAPDLFAAYQDNHPANPEATLKRRKVAASFIVGEAGESRFVGLYAIDGWEYRTAEALDAEPARQALMMRFRDATFVEMAASSGKLGRTVFDLRALPDLAELRGRLIVQRPAGRAYVRLAENFDMPIVEVAREARFVPTAPDWDAFVVTGVEMRTLPRVWRARLREWRGVYLIVDEADGARYVGSAYGDQNIAGRWEAHVAGDMGVTAELAKRDPARFRFSILELVSPTAPVDVVLALETSWKHRLHTRAWGLNKN
jgi:GIY-YIG catalytic domain